MAFDPDKYLAKKSAPAAKSFDPDAYLAKAPKKSAVMSGIRGGVQGLLQNFADEGAGVIGATGELLTGMSGFDKLGDTYREYRDAYRRDDEDYKRDNPKSFTTGEIGAGVASSFIPGVGLAKGSKALQAAKLGLLSGAGSSEADLTKGEVSELAKDAVVSGAMSAGLTKGIDVLGKVPKSLRKKAEKLAVAATGATRKQAEKLAPNTGSELLDLGLIKPFGTPKGIAERAEDLMDAHGKKIGEALEIADAKGIKVEPSVVLNKLDDEIAKLDKMGSGYEGQVRQLKKIKASVARSLDKHAAGGKAGPLEKVPVSAIEMEKRSLDKGKKIDFLRPDKSIAEKRAYRVLRDTTDAELESSLPEVAQSFKKSKRIFGLMDPVEDAAAKRALQLENHPKGGLLDMSAMGLGGLLAGDGMSLTGKGALAIAAALARRIAAPRINSTLATGANLASKATKPLSVLETEKLIDAISRTAPASTPAIKRKIREE